LYRTSGRILDRIFGIVRPSCAHGYFPCLTLLWPCPRPALAMAWLPCHVVGRAPSSSHMWVLGYAATSPPSLSRLSPRSLPQEHERAHHGHPSTQPPSPFFPSPPRLATFWSSPCHRRRMACIDLARPLSGPRRAMPPIAVGCRHRCRVLLWPGHHGPS
jgi:hypothetical protein